MTRRVLNGVYLPVRAAITAPVSAVALAVNYGYSRLPGRNVEYRWNREHWVFVCPGGPTSLGAGATTFGGVINTRLSYDALLSGNDGQLMWHETKHTDQWAIFGPAFAAVYGVAALWDLIGVKRKGWPLGSHNAFEIWAGLTEGGYRRTTDSA